MIIIIVVLIILAILIKIKKENIHIEWSSILKKGFEKKDDMYGIYCWDGKQGYGKSFSVASYINKIRDNRKVITNQKGYYEKHKDFAIYEPNIYVIIDKFNNNIYTSNYIIFFDELFSIVKKGDRLPQEIETFISQLRKRHLIFLTTVQEWLDSNISFRRYVKFSISCYMRNIFKRAISINKVRSGYELKWNEEIKEYDAPILWTSIRKADLETANSYDTDEVIYISKKPVSKIK